MDEIREKFEALNPVPESIFWDGEFYQARSWPNSTSIGEVHAEAWQNRWEGYQKGVKDMQAENERLRYGLEWLASITEPDSEDQAKVNELLAIKESDK